MFKMLTQILKFRKSKLEKSLKEPIFDVIKLFFF